MLKTRVAWILVATLAMAMAMGGGLALAESPEKEPAKAKTADPVIQNGSTVQLEYTLTDKDGKVLDTNKGQEPLTYTQGEGQIIPGLEKALKGLHAGDQKHVVIPPEEAYGPFKQEAVIEIPKERIPPDSQKVGTRLMARNQQGNGPPIPILVKEVKEKTIVLDANHPLAGMTLTFDVKIVSIAPTTAK